MATNELYLAVLPLVHISSGLVEETLTLYPDKNFATQFFPDEVDGYITMFKSRAEKYLIGGHVTGYAFDKEVTNDNRVIVRVTQNVG
jgi:hypothetical protein